MKDAQINSELVWHQFVNTISEHKKYVNFYPESYFLTRLPNSGVVALRKTTTDSRECAHAELDLLKMIKDDLQMEGAETSYVINLYYPTYTICADCVQLMANSLSLLNERQLVRINIHVISVVGPGHRHELSESRDHWTNELTLTPCDSRTPFIKLLRSVLSLLASYAQAFSQSRVLIQTDREFPGLFDRMAIYTELTKSRKPSQYYEEEDGQNRSRLTVCAERIEYAAEEIGYCSQRIRCILSGDQQFDKKQVMDSYFNCTFHGNTTRWDESEEQVYQELAHSVVQLPGSGLVRVYNCRLYEGHVEQALVEDLKEEIYQMFRSDISVTVYQTFTPCGYCLREVLTPFIEEVRDAGYNLKLTIKAVELYQVVRMSCRQDQGRDRCSRDRCISCLQRPAPRVYLRTAHTLSTIAKQQTFSIEALDEDDWTALRLLIRGAGNCYYDPIDYYWQMIDLRMRLDKDIDMDLEAIQNEWVYGPDL